MSFSSIPATSGMSEDTIKALDAMPESAQKEIKDFINPGPFAFVSGLKDCVATNPEIYKVMCEIPGKFRLIEMTCPPGGKDDPHDHPKHSMYFLKGGKLEITDYDETGKSKENPHVVEVPSGAPPIFPAGAHCVKNVGDEEVKVLFVEMYPMCSLCGDVEGMISPFDVAPTCYTKLAEDDDMITGMMTMKPGEEDPIHHHKDHLIYVISGGKISITPVVGEDKGEPIVKEIPLEGGIGLDAPMAAPPFAKHTLKNLGDTEIKMLFFEMKL